ncbi:transport protein particle component [Neoconidiobolus thromboides FSU 785]|nr:transport protein particle component [Neoconidiobolus thromboides FSU 785]
MLYFKLENLGFRVGMGLAERFTLDKELFNDTLDMVKFICKEFWLLLFQKQIDNLKTNHRGVYVLNDNNFKWFQTLSTTDPPAVTARQSIIYTWFPCGLIRGALFGLGINAIVVAEAVTLPQCTFQIRVGKES